MADKNYKNETKEVLKEIEDWQKIKDKSMMGAGFVEALFSPVEKLFMLLLNKRMIEKNLKIIKKFLLELQKSSTKLVHKQGIVRRARKGGLSVESVEDFRRIPVSYLDVLAKRYLTKNSIYSALQGGGLGIGSYALTLLDLPTLFMINIKMILQIGTCYGYDPDSIEEKEFALHIFYIASASGKKREEEVGRILKLINGLSKGAFDKRLSLIAGEDGIKGFINHGVIKFLKKAFTKNLPVLGVALGTHFNYLYTREAALYAYIFYRKRFLKDFSRKS